MYRKFFKRLFDFIFSFCCLIVLALPMLIIAIAVRCDSKGPAFFKTKRVGVDGKPFKFYKFRSMRTDAPKDCAPMLLDSDAYITKLGAFLRKSSLDELPQLICILKGDMSLIGPRPSGFSEKELNELRHEKGVDKVKPGLTGWAQVNGRDVTAADIEKKVSYDEEYVEKMSFAFDVKIFFLTIKKVFVRDGIVEGKDVVKVMNVENGAAESQNVEEGAQHTPEPTLNAYEIGEFVTASDEDEKQISKDQDSESGFTDEANLSDGVTVDSKLIEMKESFAAERENENIAIGE